MTGTYRLEIKRTAEKEIRGLSSEVAARVVEAIKRLAIQPQRPGARKLVGAEGYRVRVGVYRVLYTIDDKARVVTIVAVGHRREVYRR